MYDDIIGLKDPIICQRGVFFGVAPPIYTRVCIYPLGNDRSLGTFPVAAQLGQEEAQDGNERSLGTFPVAAVPHKAQDGQDEAQEGQEAKSCVYIYMYRGSFRGSPPHIYTCVYLSPWR